MGARTFDVHVRVRVLTTVAFVTAVATVVIAVTVPHLHDAAAASALHLVRFTRYLVVCRVGREEAQNKNST